MSDFDFEPVRGLPQSLPDNERMLWQGAPSWRDLAVNAFHVKKVAGYFVALAMIQGALRLWSGSTVVDAATPFLWLIPLGIAAAAILAAIAWASARTTVYTITNRRLVMRIGIALPVTFNVPFKLVDSASVCVFKNGAGDISLKLHADSKIAYLLLWPHVRPWEFSRPQPTLRSIPNADTVASLLAGALATTPISQIQPDTVRGFTEAAIAA